MDDKGNYEEDYERQSLRMVYNSSNKLNSETIDNYLKDARFFWNYRNLNIENETSGNFFHFLEDFKRFNQSYLKLSIYHKNQIEKKIEQLKKFITFGISLDSHFEEMALKILHISKYKTKIALFFLFKGINPFLDEEVENFKSNCEFFQQEILAYISDFYDEDDNN